MSRSAVVPVLKFVGTIGVGLLTGVSYATATSSIPSLYSLPTVAVATSAYNQHLTSTKRQIAFLGATSATAYLLAFALAPPRGGRHPYLIWTSMVIAISSGVDYLLTIRDDAKAGILKSRNAKVGDDDFVNIEQSGILNGEEVRRSLESWRFREIVRGGLTGLAFAMATVGLWGDGAHVRARVA